MRSDDRRRVLTSFSSWLRRATFASFLLAIVTYALASESRTGRGEAIYNYYCYQCHGYAGDARTLASTYLSPRPRDFRHTDPASLSRAAMIETVTLGGAGTAMAGFATVLSKQDISAVVDYVRSAFMNGSASDARYHTRENGWPNHERYAAAFPFATGELALDAPAGELTEEQLHGKRLFMGSCISCHDRSRVEQEGPAWDIRALSYPRNHYSHRAPVPVDGMTSATPHVLHERVPAISGLSEAERNGERLFQDNCAFCHAADGTGRNWIGSFLDPHPRDLTSARLREMSLEDIVAAITNGLTGTSMPAWRDVLSRREILDVAAYVRSVFAGTARAPADDATTTVQGLPANAALPVWRRDSIQPK